MPRKVFVAGEILTAAAVNENLMDQAVMSFAGSAARGSAIPSPVEGMVTYLEDVNGLSLYDGSSWVPAASGATLGAGSILQVVSTTLLGSFTYNTNTFATVTGLEATITPISTSSKIIIFCSVSHGGDYWNNAGGRVRLRRNSTDIAVSTAGATVDDTIGLYELAAASPDTNGLIAVASFNFLDSPATTSSVTYGIQVAKRISGGGASYIGRAGDNGRAGISTITVMEVAG